jgi:signal transduction histidine kinase
MNRSTTDWPSRLEWMLIVSAWTTIALLTAVEEVLGARGGGVEWSRFPAAFGQEMFEYGFWILLTPFVFWLARTLPLERPSAPRNVVIHFAIAIVAAFSVDIADISLRRALFPVGGPPADFNVLQIITRLWFINELIVYFVILAAGFARDYYLQKKQRQEEAERLQERTLALEQQLTEARLEALRMQLNPHFLFNTLHAVSTLVGRDPQGVRRMIARLSELLRRVLDEEAPQEIPLAEELDMLRDYLKIQEIRFQGRLDISIDVPTDLQQAHVPYLILQPLAENAIKHGASRVRGTGRIAIEGQRADDRLVLTVRDNGPGFEEDGTFTPGIGLRNVEARLQGLYGAAYRLDVEAADGPGVVTTLAVPYHVGADLYAPGDGAPADLAPATTSSPDGINDETAADEKPASVQGAGSDDAVLTTSAADHD